MKITIDNLTVHYETYGDNTKQPLVLIGGWPMNLLSLNLVNFDPTPILNELTKHFYVILPENPGFLRSDPPKTVWSVYDYGKYIHEFIKTLDIQNPIVVGKSFGGGVTLTYANMYPDDRIKSVIIIDGAIYNNDEY